MAQLDATRPLLDKVALVTGAGRGPGRAFACVVEVFAGPLGAFVSDQVLRVDVGGQCRAARGLACIPRPIISDNASR